MRSRLSEVKIQKPVTQTSAAIPLLLRTDGRAFLFYVEPERQQVTVF